jgi:hypothetical protein
MNTNKEHNKEYNFDLKSTMVPMWKYSPEFLDKLYLERKLREQFVKVKIIDK